MLAAHRDAQGHLGVAARRGRTPAGSPTSAEQVAIDAPHQVDRRALDAGDLLDARRGPGARGPGRGSAASDAGLLPAHVGDDAESLGDQLDDSLVKVAETVAKREQLAVGFGHAASVRFGG